MGWQHLQFISTCWDWGGCQLCLPTGVINSSLWAFPACFSKVFMDGRKTLPCSVSIFKVAELSELFLLCLGRMWNHHHWRLLKTDQTSSCLQKHWSSWPYWKAKGLTRGHSGTFAFLFTTFALTWHNLWRTISSARGLHNTWTWWWQKAIELRNENALSCAVDKQNGEETN